MADIVKREKSLPVEMLPGLVRRTLVSGEKMMICEFTFEQGVEIPNHSHEHEQVGYVVSGRVRLIIDGKSFELCPGDSYHAPSGVPHSAFTLEPSVLVDVFSPPREDYR